MKIIVAGGGTAADYIVENFKDQDYELVVINPDREKAEEIVKTYKIPVFYGDPTKVSTLRDTHIEGSDIFIALGNKDCDNYVACILAKKIFKAKKCICIVDNPKNVEVFRQLGINSVISSTQLLATSIVSESSIESLTKSMSLEDEKIVLTEVVIKESYAIAHKHIMEIDFPKTGNISCIYRSPRVIIPNGSTLILPKDKLLFVSSPNDQQAIIDFIQKSKKTK